MPCQAAIPTALFEVLGFCVFLFFIFKGYLVDLRTLIVYSTWVFFFCFL